MVDQHDEKGEREDQPVADVRDLTIIGDVLCRNQRVVVCACDLRPYWRRALEKGHNAKRKRIL